MNEKTAWKQTILQKSHQRDKHLGCPPSKILWTIPKVDERRTSTNGAEKKKKKLLTMHKVLHPRDGVYKLYVSKKEKGRGLTSIEDTIDASTQRLEDNIKDTEKDRFKRPETSKESLGIWGYKRIT